MESPIAKSYTVHMKRRTLVWFYMLSMQTKRSVKVESKVGSLLNRLIQISWFYASITFLQCNIHRNYGFIRVLSQTPRMGVFIPVHSICSILNPVLCNILPAAHAITRCDSTSSLFGIGKRTVFKVLKDSPENFRDLSTLADCDTDKSIDAASKLVCRLYDQKGKLKEDHVDLNKLRVRLATLRDACLAKLPPCEATFTQHVLRSSLQINIWMTAHVAKPPMKSAVLFGWEDRNGLVPVYFKGQMSSDFLQDLVCTCKGKSVCMKGCICFEQSLSCTDLCPCQAGDLCRNENTHLAISRNTDEDDDIWSHFFSFSSSLHLFHRIKLLLSKLWSQIKQSFISNIVTINSR